MYKTANFLRDTTDNLVNRLHKVATLDNAIVWSELTDQFVFCIDLLQISAQWSQADAWVDLLEAKFDQALRDAGRTGWGDWG